MADVQLSEKLLAGLAGWDVVKQARSIVAEDRVLSSCWEPPILRGVVQSGSSSYRAGLAIRRENDAENLCTCRQSREWGTLCAHSIAVGLHFLKPTPRPTSPTSPTGPPRPTTTPRPSRDVRRLPRADEEPTATGIPLEISVILPPGLPEALARGRVTVFFEGRTARGVLPLASVPFDTPYRLETADRTLLETAERLAAGDTPAMLTLASGDLAELLEALVDHPRVSLAKTQRLRVSREPSPLPLAAQLASDGAIQVRVRSQPGKQPPAFLRGTSRAWVLAGAEIRPLALPANCLAVLDGPLRLTRQQVPEFVLGTWKTLAESADLQADFSPADFELTPQPPKLLLHLAGGLATLTAHLQCAYGPRVLTLGLPATGEPEWMPDPSHPRRYTARDPAAERAALARLQRGGFSGPDAQGRFHLHGQNAVLTFFAREFPKLEREWNVTLEERLDRSTKQNLERVEPRFAVTPSGEQWFDLAVSWGTSGGQTLPSAEVQRLLRGGQNFSRLANGRFALIDTGAVEELEEILVDCAPDQHAGGYRIDQAQAGFLSSTLKSRGWEPVAPVAWRERARQLSGDVRLECPPLAQLETVLRPYQKQGVAWMTFLRRNGFGGVLADEMGLGKTLQTLALLRSFATANSGPGAPPRLPHLVVCPTSLVPNWVGEAARFVPDLRVLSLHGSDRLPRFDRIPTSDLVITSYALVRRDFERYRGVEFDTVILDEAQHIKNRQTQNAQAVKALRSRHRLVLTGTPLENSVLDLWSIFDFLMPGYLGSAQDFRDRYEVPIVRERCAASQARLARRVRPFLLRRLKRDVAPELPPRIDQVVWCDLTPDQAAVYQQLLESTRREVNDAVGAQGLARSRLLVLTALLRLRQACCDLRLLGAAEPALTDESDKSDKSESSATPATAPPPPPGAKLETFSELLEEVLDGNHRVLVFSQFTRMLALLEERLRADQVPYCYLDGSTRDRGGEVARFQNSPDIPVFLISLKAGGVGLNLTAADTVVHFDPWWNPAVEDQASDRAHRLGQTRVVTSYKLIARGTVEEKILALQKRKRETIQGLLSDEEQLTGSLGWEEIQELLA